MTKENKSKSPSTNTLTTLALQPAMCDRTVKASWTYFPQGPLNIPQVLHCVPN